MAQKESNEYYFIETHVFCSKNSTWIKFNCKKNLFGEKLHSGLLYILIGNLINLYKIYSPIMNIFCCCISMP